MRQVAAVLLVSVLTAPAAAAHDLERTAVTLTFADDGSFELRIANDPNWLLLRLESFAGGRVPPRVTPEARDARLQELGAVMADRVVLFVDGHEVRPSEVDYVPSAGSYRLRGRVPPSARSLRWLYGAVIDPYRLTIHRADGRTVTEMIEGSNWSGPLDLSGQFRQATFLPPDASPIAALIAAFVIGLYLRLRTLRSA